MKYYLLVLYQYAAVLENAKYIKTKTFTKSDVDTILPNMMWWMPSVWSKKNYIKF